MQHAAKLKLVAHFCKQIPQEEMFQKNPFQMKTLFFAPEEPEHQKKWHQQAEIGLQDFQWKTMFWWMTFIFVGFKN